MAARYSWVLVGKPGLERASAALRDVNWDLNEKFHELDSRGSLRSSTLTSLCDIGRRLRVLKRSPVWRDEGRRRGGREGTVMPTEGTS